MIRVKGESSAMINSYRGGHDYSYEVTPRTDDVLRRRYQLSDVPEFVRIDHPNRQPFRANSGLAASMERRME